MAKSGMAKGGMVKGGMVKGAMVIERWCERLLASYARLRRERSRRSVACARCAGP